MAKVGPWAWREFCNQLRLENARRTSMHVPSSLPFTHVYHLRCTHTFDVLVTNRSTLSLLFSSLLSWIWIISSASGSPSFPKARFGMSLNNPSVEYTNHNRYVGTLHEINPEQSTIALEDVYSYGTEGRKVERFIPASQQKFEYIVFRGNDVKDIKIVEAEQESQKPSPPSIPNDPAILVRIPNSCPETPSRMKHFGC